MSGHMVIIGNGVAGFSAARRLRREDADLTISIFSDEAHPFYLRSRLKDYIAGLLTDYEMILETRNLYRRERLNLFLGTPVAGVDAAGHEVVLADGQRVRYDRLLLAMGRAPAPLAVPGGDLRGVFSLRTLADAQAIQEWMARRRTALVLGESIVSIQLAESLARLGADVTCSLLGEHFWPDVLDLTASSMVEELLEQIGVRILRRVRVERIIGQGGDVAGVEFTGGTVVPCDMVGHGCSFRPNTDILAGGSIDCDAGGVLVNDFLETAVEGVFAAGDVISPGAGRRGDASPTLPWRNAFKLGQTAALNMLGGKTPVDSFSAGIKTRVCDVNLAVIGRGNLGEMEPSVHVEHSRQGSAYRRLVFRDEMLVGAILVGDTSHASMLARDIRRGSMRIGLNSGLVSALMAGVPRLTEPLEAACPICTDRVRLPMGALVGRRFACRSCSSRLILSYSGGRLAIVPAAEE